MRFNRTKKRFVSYLLVMVLMITGMTGYQANINADTEDKDVIELTPWTFYQTGTYTNLWEPWELCAYSGVTFGNSGVTPLTADDLPHGITGGSDVRDPLTVISDGISDTFAATIESNGWEADWINEKNNPWTLQAYMENLKFEQKHLYTIKFNAKATSLKYADIFLLNSESQTIAIGTEEKSYSIDLGCYVTSTTLGFMFGAYSFTDDVIATVEQNWSGTVYISDFEIIDNGIDPSMTPETTTEMVTEPITEEIPTEETTSENVTAPITEETTTEKTTAEEVTSENESEENIPQIYVNESVSFSIDYETTAKYKFTAPEDGVYYFFTRGSSDTYGSLIYQGQSIAEDDDNGDNYNFLFEKTLVKGEVYTIVVNSWESSLYETELVVMDMASINGIHSIEGEHIVANIGDDVVLEPIFYNYWGDEINLDEIDASNITYRWNEEHVGEYNMDDVITNEVLGTERVYTVENIQEENCIYRGGGRQYVCTVTVGEEEYRAAFWIFDGSYPRYWIEFEEENVFGIVGKSVDMFTQVSDFYTGEVETETDMFRYEWKEVLNGEVTILSGMMGHESSLWWTISEEHLYDSKTNDFYLQCDVYEPYYDDGVENERYIGTKKFYIYEKQDAYSVEERNNILYCATEGETVTLKPTIYCDGEPLSDISDEFTFVWSKIFDGTSESLNCTDKELQLNVGLEDYDNGTKYCVEVFYKGSSIGKETYVLKDESKKVSCIMLQTVYAPLGGIKEITPWIFYENGDYFDYKEYRFEWYRYNYDAEDMVEKVSDEYLLTINPVKEDHFENSCSYTYIMYDRWGNKILSSQVFIKKQELALSGGYKSIIVEEGQQIELEAQLWDNENWTYVDLSQGNYSFTWKQYIEGGYIELSETSYKYLVESVSKDDLYKEESASSYYVCEITDNDSDITYTSRIELIAKEDSHCNIYDENMGAIIDGCKYGTEYEFPNYNHEIGYLCNGKIYKPGASITVTEDLYITPIDSLDVMLYEGASMRLSEPSGLRFKAGVSTDEMGILELEDVITTGMLVTTNDLYENNGCQLTLDSEYTILNIKNNHLYEQNGLYCGAVVNINENNYERDFIARAYVTVNYADGSTETIYSNMSSVRSVSDVARAIKAAGYPGFTGEDVAIIDKYIKE